MISRRLGLAFFVVAVGCEKPPEPTKNTVEPEKAARAWAEKLQIPIRGAACTSVDSDNDGYVSCVLSIDRGDLQPMYQNLQCAELGSIKAGGCKPDSKNPQVAIVDWRAGMNNSPKPPPCPAAPPPPPPSSGSARPGGAPPPLFLP
jgi:hypothetical protein